MNKVLGPNFFSRPTLEVARDLLGKVLIRRLRRREIVGIITEVEAYVGINDKASHASRGRTKRTEIMFGKPGLWYVYMIYGMHYCLNIVTEKKDYPAAILIRSVIGRPAFYNVAGPGRVCRYFKINGSFNGKQAGKKFGLWIQDEGIKVNPRRIRRGKRIGVDYAGEWKDKLWRFYLERI